jgi:hypothetical protein
MDVTMEIGKNIVRGTFVLHVLKIVKTCFFYQGYFIGPHV